MSQTERIQIMVNGKVDTVIGGDGWASPREAVEDYHQWLIDRIARDQGVSQAFGFFQSFYTKCDFNPSYPADKPGITGDYANEMLQAVTTKASYIISEAKKRKVIFAKADAELEKHLEGQKTEASRKTERVKRNKAAAPAPKRIDTGIDKDWKPSESAKAKRDEFMSGLMAFMDKGEEEKENTPSSSGMRP